MTDSESRGSRPALTSDDLPQPLGPKITPTLKVLSGSVSSMRVFQKWMLSGSPSATGAGEQLEEEVGVVLVEGPQALRDDLDASWGGLVSIVADDRRPPEFLAAFGCDVGAVSAHPDGPLNALFPFESLRQSRTSSMDR